MKCLHHVQQASSDPLLTFWLLGRALEQNISSHSTDCLTWHDSMLAVFSLSIIWGQLCNLIPQMDSFLFSCRLWGERADQAAPFLDGLTRTRSAAPTSQSPLDISLFDFAEWPLCGCQTVMTSSTVKNNNNNKTRVPIDINKLLITKILYLNYFAACD